MFGYILANPQYMNDDEYQRYRSAYCGLCRTLGRRHGQLSRLSLTYDMTFLLLFLGALYEPKEERSTFRCFMHPKDKRTAMTTKFTEYGADMNILLAYLNCLDDWQDDKSLVALLESAVFRGSYKEAVSRYPRQAQAVTDALVRLSEIEKRGEYDLDAGANCFGELLGELFVYDEGDYWASRLRQFGWSLGKFIYFYDACMDYEKDMKKGNYNPLIGNIPEPFSVEYCRQMLTMLISQCTGIFEGLPIQQDDGIIRNILYSGVWMRLDEKYKNDGDRSAAE